MRLDKPAPTSTRLAARFKACSCARAALPCGAMAHSNEMQQQEAPAIADFEKSLDALESLVSRMERGDLSLEDSVTAFERGMQLYQSCQKALTEAELRVDLLLKGHDPAGRSPFNPETP